MKSTGCNNLALRCNQIPVGYVSGTHERVDASHRGGRTVGKAEIVSPGSELLQADDRAVSRANFASRRSLGDRMTECHPNSMLIASK
jgi:hypothetical protein